MPIQFAQKPNDLSSTTNTSQPTPSATSLPESPTSSPSPASSPSSSSSSSLSSTSSSVVAIRSSQQSRHHRQAPTLAHPHSIIATPSPHKRQKCARMTEEAETTAQLRHGLQHAGAGSTSASSGGALVVAASSFRFGTATPPASPPTPSSTAAHLHLHGANGGGGAGRRPSGARGHDKLDLSHKSRSANDVLLDVVGGGGNSNDSGARSLNGISHATTVSGAGSGTADRGAKSPALMANGPIMGGRLQFFKDGKFILELATSGDGDRSGWVSVPQKTYWPPMAAPATTNGFGILLQKNEGSTSISYSDDNSSVQSSPWQRDHCWKQTTPRKHISAEMALYFLRPAGSVLAAHLHKTARVCRRRPYFRVAVHDDESIAPAAITQNHPGTNDCPPNNNKMHDDKDEVDAVQTECLPSDDIHVDGKDQEDNIPKEQDANEATKKSNLLHTDMEVVPTEDAEKQPSSPKPLGKNDPLSDSMDFIDVETVKIENPDTQSKHLSPTRLPRKSLLVRRTKPRNPKCTKRRQLHDVLQHLVDRIPKNSSPIVMRSSASVTHLTTASSRINDVQHSQQHVSPRKRILRELEKVSLEESHSTKRSRSKVNHNHTYAVATSPSVASRSPPTNSYAAKSSVLCANTSLNGSPLANGTHLPAPVVQPTSRPISSYSITSLLGHNSSNSSSANHSSSHSSHITSTHSTDPDYHRKTPSSPKSPASSNHHHNHPHNFQPHAKPSAQSVSAFSSATRKKSSPSSCLSPIISQNFARSPSLNSPINYGARSRSPDLSPSPEQIYSRYRQTPYSIPPTTVSSPNSTQYHPHPYLATSRASPSSGALSPPSASDASTTSTQHRYRYGSPTYSPQHQPLPPPPPHPTHSSPTPFSSRYQTTAATYSQISPQTYPPIKHPHLITSPPYTSTVSTASHMSRFRDTSPNGLPSRSDLSRESTASSSYGGNSTPRTVPKKSVALRNAYTSPASSPSNADSSRNGDYMRVSAKEEAMRKAMDGTAATRSRSPTPAELQRQYEKELAHMHSLAAGGGATLAELEAANASLIRAGLVPSAQHHQHHQQQQQAAAAAAAMAANMYRGMYMMPPSAAGQMSAAAAAAAGFLQPVYYPSMAFPGGAFRGPAWMHHAPQSPYAAMQHPHSRFAANPLLAAAAAYQQQQQGMQPAGVAPQTSPLAHHSPSASGGHGHAGGAAHHQQQQSHMQHHLPWGGGGAALSGGATAHVAAQSNDEPVSLVKNEPSSDVPLNLSKH